MSVDSFVKQVLSPIDLDDFFNAHWERQPLHVDRDDDEHFADLISVADIERILSTQDLRFPECQLTQSGQHVDAAEYSDSSGRLIPLRVVQRHVDGATLVISRAHRRIPGLARLVRDAIMTLQWRCQANVYLSPPGRQGFNPHYDTHDVFILQAAGAKRFRFYRGGVKLPLVADAFDSSMTIDPEVVEEVVLAAGDTLYIPRGLAHDAVAEPGCTSLHVTLGVFPVTEVDLARQCLQIASEKRVELRRSLSRDEWLNQSVGPDAQANSALSSLNVRSLAPFRQEALSRLRDDVFIEADRCCESLLSDVVEGVNGVNVVNTVNVVNAANAANVVDAELSETDVDEAVLETIQSGLLVERQGNRLKLRTLGQVLEFEGAMATAVELLLARGSIKVSELEALDEQQRLLLSNRLLRERIVRIAIC